MKYDKIAVGQRIKAIRQSKGLTLEDFGKKFGASKGNAQAWEIGRTLPRVSRLKEIAEYADISVEYLLTGYDDNTPQSEIQEIYNELTEHRQEKVLTYAKEQLQEQQNNIPVIQEDTTNYNVTELKKIPVIEALSAGTGYAYGDNEVDYYYTDRDDLKPYDFATLVVGDSMSPLYEDGEIVLIKKGYDNIQGGIYAVDYDGESYLKKVYNDGDRFRLVSINRDYKDKHIYLHDLDNVYFNIIGYVVDSFEPIQP